MRRKVTAATKLVLFQRPAEAPLWLGIIYRSSQIRSFDAINDVCGLTFMYYVRGTGPMDTTPLLDFLSLNLEKNIYINLVSLSDLIVRLIFQAKYSRYHRKYVNINSYMKASGSSSRPRGTNKISIASIGSSPSNPRSGRPEYEHLQE